MPTPNRTLFSSAPLAVLVVIVVIGASGGSLAAQERPAIVFVDRDLVASAPALLRGQFASEHLRVLEADDSVRTLAGPSLGAGSVSAALDPDVSFDGTTIVFAGFAPADAAWRIFTIRSDGSELAQITRSDREVDRTRVAAVLERYDDLDPCWLPDGRICFVSTRYPASAPDSRVRGTNLFVVGADGSDLHRITTERYAADTPSVDPRTGRIVYSRWWRSSAQLANPTRPGYYAPVGAPSPRGTAAESLAAPSLLLSQLTGMNTWTLASIRPDGDDLRMFAGLAIDRVRSIAYRPSFTRSGDALAMFLRATPVPGLLGEWGLRRYARGAVDAVDLGGPQFLAASPGDGLVYESASELPDGRLVVVGRPWGSVEDRDLWIQPNAAAPPERLVRRDATEELAAVPLVARASPPTIADLPRRRLAELPPRTVEEAYAEGGSFTFLAENIFANAPLDRVGVSAAPSVRAAQFIEFWMNSPALGSAGVGAQPIQIDRVQVPLDGRVEKELPAGVPLFEVLRLANDRVPLTRDGNVYHVAGHNFGVAGAVARCLGCHAGHSFEEVPDVDGPIFSNLAPGADVRTELGAHPVAGLAADLVDRNVSTVWLASPNANAAFELSWLAPIRVREVVLHAALAFGAASGVESALVTTSHGDAVVATETRAWDRSRRSTAIALDETASIDRVRVDLFVRERAPGETLVDVPGLAEIEVIATPSLEVRPFARWFRRGDADCNGTLSVTDGIRVLRALFAGAGLCCEAAADSDGDGRVVISDAVRIFQFLFIAGAPLDSFERCDPRPVVSLDCETATCR